MNDSLLLAYYSNQDIRSRIAEFENDGSTDFRPSLSPSDAACRRPPRNFEFWQHMAAGRQLQRSLWDRRGLVVQLDLKYINFDHPYLVYLEPQHAFCAQQPVVTELLSQLTRYGLVPLHVLTACGHQFLWNVEPSSRTFQQLAQLGRRSCSTVPRDAGGEGMPTEMALAFTGVGMIVEYLSQEVLRRARPRCTIPIQLTAVAPISGQRGREVVSIDLSLYGEPLGKQMIQVPYTATREVQRLSLPSPSRGLPAWLIPIPLETGEEGDPLELRNPFRIASRARHTRAVIPDCSEAFAGLLAAYVASPLARFHDEYYATEPHPPEQWPTTYHRMQGDQLPPCLVELLKPSGQGNLAPSALQHITRGLLGLGWHPRHIAGLLWSCRQPEQTAAAWTAMHNAKHWADLHVRVFAGQVSAGVDRMGDFDCLSTRKRGYCPGTPCDVDLVDLARTAVARPDL